MLRSALSAVKAGNVEAGGWPVPQDQAATSGFQFAFGYCTRISIIRECLPLAGRLLGRTPIAGWTPCLSGLHTEGNQVPLARVRRAHALLMTIFHALPAIPFERQTADVTPALRRLFTERATMARLILDLLDLTA
jgi:hypothetical protein